MIGGLASGAVRGIVEGVGSTLDELFTSDDERAKARLALEKVAQLPRLRELDRQIAEAQHPSIFVAGARPAMLWGAAAGVVWQFLGQPILAWALTVIAFYSGEAPPPMPPSLDVYELIALLTGAGGLYRMRGVEKERGAARENLQPEIGGVRRG